MSRTDGQISGMAGEFLAVGKLFKLGLQASVTLGNAKSIDIFAYNVNTKKNFNIQVKTCRKKNCFPIKVEDVEKEHIYIFIFLNDINVSENYYIVDGKTLLNNVNEYWGSSYKGAKPSTIPGINYGPLKMFENNWDLFLK
mgnify:CR=1 FL=1